MDLSYFAFSVWEFLVAHGLPLAALLVIGILVPRAGRLLVRVITSRLDRGEETTKATLALVGALVYIIEAIAYFVLVLLALTNIGVPAMGAAVPATVVSAAIGFGAQNIIGDFLAGFFIITEKQFGVGDYVAFQGGSSPVEGTVVSLTLRATRVRTPSGEVVSVPNSTAAVCVNYSQEWSRAVVNLDIPMVGGESMEDLVHSVRATAEEALAEPDTATEVIGELEVLPATELTPPAAAGMPWTVGFRVLVQVNPAMQWAVERAIRASLVNAFWDRYRAAGTVPGAPNAVLAAPPTRAAAGPGRGDDAATGRAGAPVAAGAGRPATRPVTPPAGGSESGPQSGPAFTSAQAGPTGQAGTSPQSGESGQSGPAGTAPSPTAGPGTGARGTGGDTPGTDAATDPATADADASTAPPTVTATGTATSTATTAHGGGDGGDGGDGHADGGDGSGDGSSGTDSDADGTDIVDDVREHGIWRRDSHTSPLRRWLSFGGRVRPSTTGLVIALIVLGLLGAFSVNPSGGDAGILSPAKYRDHHHSPATTSVAPSTRPSAAPSSAATPAPSGSGSAAPSDAADPSGDRGAPQSADPASPSASRDDRDGSRSSGQGSTDTTGTGRGADRGDATGGPTPGSTGGTGGGQGQGGQTGDGTGGTGGTGQGAQTGHGGQGADSGQGGQGGQGTDAGRQG
ncbi:mechanosensitive ion channel family protein [Corynebacterium bovis]|uniref:mechanosensitive ion channel family protein n=1 Tax=Corynebacterium bovis TaxID=36808 RepID=UPI0027BB1F32|nr:mechanosensitive ion channel family protein [Corynebacterium bovis]